jgi:hypothetical protein
MDEVIAKILIALFALSGGKFSHLTTRIPPEMNWSLSGHIPRSGLIKTWEQRSTRGKQKAISSI